MNTYRVRFYTGNRKSYISVKVQALGAMGALDKALFSARSICDDFDTRYSPSHIRVKEIKHVLICTGI